MNYSDLGKRSNRTRHTRIHDTSHSYSNTSLEKARWWLTGRRTDLPQTDLLADQPTDVATDLVAYSFILVIYFHIYRVTSFEKWSDDNPSMNEQEWIGSVYMK